MAMSELEKFMPPFEQSQPEKILASFDGEQKTVQDQVKQEIQNCLGIEQKDIERIELLKVENLPEHYRAQFEILHDERLNGVTIAVVPDELWVKGDQPSESSADKQLILIKKSYFETQENPDEIAWLCHELAHCQNFLDSQSPEEYQDNMQKLAFEDLNTGFPYPNNLVEKFTFTRQFQYLKEQGKSRDEVLEMLSHDYKEKDIPFFSRLLDAVYGE